MDGALTQVMKGGVAGLAATVPMTLAMAAMHRLLPKRERYPLPPRVITENLLEKAEVDDKLPEEHETGLTLMNHFGYGAAMGGIYALGINAVGKRPGVASGVAFGLCVWAASYQAMLPLIGLHPPADDEPARRNSLMVTAHIVWGAALGIALGSVDQRGESRDAQ